MPALLNDKKKYIALLAGFFVLESVLSFWTGHEYDMRVWFNTGLWISQGINIYVPADHLGYPPLWALWCGVSHNIYLFFGANLELWRFLIKLPMILAHLALAYFVGRFAEKRFDHKKTSLILFFTLTWSFFFFVGPIWGQINVISLLLTFIAFHFVIDKQPSKGAMFLGLATALKIYPIVALPAFIVYVLKNNSRLVAAKFTTIAFAVPLILTTLIFSVFQWDILYFVRTVFYSTPAFESNPTLIEVGCMNFWSFVSLQKIDMALQWPFRLLWIPLLLAAMVYWLRKDKMGEAEFTISIISFYVLFMVSYGWITEQYFLDLLPFTFLLILGYKSKHVYLYLLGLFQVLVYAFTVTNQGLLVFNPLLASVSPSIASSLTNFYADTDLVWIVRGYLGLAVSVSLLLFLIAFMKPQVFQFMAKKLTCLAGKLRMKK